jgi:CRP/FNR family transcriptional regulator, cyclic AMP receptor protein
LTRGASGRSFAHPRGSGQRESSSPFPRTTVSKQTAEFLSTVPLFNGLQPAELESFAELVRERTYPKGSVILFEKDPGDALFVVHSGRVKVVLIGEDGREVILGVLGVGEHFGELSLIDDQPRSAHVIAMEDSSLLVLQREDFRRRVEASPAVAWALLTELSRRLRRADDKIGGLVLLDVPGRIARLLLDLAEEGDGVRVERVLTHQTIAQMIGASRETVSRTMKEFQDSGWIVVDHRRISLGDAEALRRRTLTRP